MQKGCLTVAPDGHGRSGPRRNYIGDTPPLQPYVHVHVDNVDNVHHELPANRGRAVSSITRGIKSRTEVACSTGQRSLVVDKREARPDYTRRVSSVVVFKVHIYVYAIAADGRRRYYDHGIRFPLLRETE